MFILPLLAILLGLEFFLAFNRVTKSYEETLRKSYNILIISKNPVSEGEFKSIDPNIKKVEQISREKIANITPDMSIVNKQKVVNSMPYFFSLELNKFLDNKEIDHIKEKILRQIPNLKTVETFKDDHNTKYNLFMFVKLLFWVFVFLISLVSTFLVIKQMEVWLMAHSKRIHIMEIFGAPVLLRSGVLIKTGLIDAVISVVLATSIFLYLKYQFIPNSGIEILIKEQDLIFKWWDSLVMMMVSLTIVLISVFFVIYKSEGVEE
jgi:cell division transport system permease protein